MKIKLFFIVCILFGLSHSAHASYCCSSWKSNPWNKIGIWPTTYYPLSTGFLVDYDINRMWNIGVDIGYMPYLYSSTMQYPAYASLNNWDEATEETIQKSFDSSFSFSLLFKFFPLRNQGLYVSGGYTFLGFGGDFIGVDTLSIMFPNFVASPEGQELILTQSTVLLETFVHNIRASVGYRFFLSKRIALLTELGVFKTIKAHISPDDVEPYINDLLVDLITIPFAGVGIGYYFN